MDKVSIGYDMGESTFVILATLNNSRCHASDSEFETMVQVMILLWQGVEPDFDIIVVEREDTPDEVDF